MGRYVKWVLNGRFVAEGAEVRFMKECMGGECDDLTITVELFHDRVAGSSSSTPLLRMAAGYFQVLIFIPLTQRAGTQGRKDAGVECGPPRRAAHASPLHVSQGV